MAGKTAIFTPETFRFFRELGRNNRKEWMDANRARYRAHVVEPLHKLLDGLAPRVLELHPGFDVSGRTGTSFSRINRDIRFAADKSPYRAQMYLMFSEANAAPGDDGQLYVGVSAEAVTVGFRIYGGTRVSSLARIAGPRAIHNPRWLEQQVRRLARKYQSYWYSAEKGEWKKHGGWPTKPEEWKRLKGWIVRRKMAPAAVRANFPNEVVKIFREVIPLYRFTGSLDWKA